MANTVISIFPNPDLAQQAKSHLLATGFTDQQIDIKIASYKSHDPLSESETEEAGIMEKITAFFKEMFGADDAEVSNYSEAGRRGCIVTVHTATSEDAEEVAAILDAFGAMDVGETSGSYFPENEGGTSRHQFLDDPLHESADNINTERKEQVSRLKSRIVARASDKKYWTNRE
jgi:predicted SnoaL-like aldol condensation-catalyzing enzyme